MKLRPELRRIVDELLARTPRGAAVELDAIGEAIGARAISSEEIDAMLTVIETAGRRVTSPPGGEGEANLKVVLATARGLRQELGRAPRSEEIAARAALTPAAVAHALALARVIQRWAGPRALAALRLSSLAARRRPTPLTHDCFARWRRASGALPRGPAPRSGGGSDDGRLVWLASGELL